MAVVAKPVIGSTRKLDDKFRKAAIGKRLSRKQQAVEDGKLSNLPDDRSSFEGI